MKISKIVIFMPLYLILYNTYSGSYLLHKVISYLYVRVVCRVQTPTLDRQDIY